MWDRGEGCSSSLLLLTVHANILQLHFTASTNDRNWEVFLSPVMDSVDVSAVPYNLVNLVRYAVYMDNIAAKPPSGQHEPASIYPEPSSSSSLTNQEHLKIRDGFDPGRLELWEKVVGGEVKAACGAVAGEALCFEGPGNRYCTMADIDTSEGGWVHFTLHVAAQGKPANVVLEHKSLGGPWQEIRQCLRPCEPVVRWEHEACDAEPLVEGTPVKFIEYSVPIPKSAQTRATKFRWRQAAPRGLPLPHRPMWVLDDVYIELTHDAPDVELRMLENGSQEGRASVSVQFSTFVTGFETADVIVSGAVVTSLASQDGDKGSGSLFLLSISNIGKTNTGVTVVKVPKGVVADVYDNPNRPSDVLNIAWEGGPHISQAELGSRISENVSCGRFEDTIRLMSARIQSLEAHIYQLNSEISRLKRA